MNTKLIKIGLILVIIGNLLGIAFSAMVIWADMEANLFKYGVTADKKLLFFDCPLLINGDEESQIKVRLKNNRDKVMTPYIRAYVSEEHITLNRQSAIALTIEPGDTAEIIWKIYPEDAVYDQFVFFRVFLNDDYPYPSRVGNCGVWVTDIPLLSGKQITGFSLAALLLLVIGGNALLLKQSVPHTKKIKEIIIGNRYLSGILLIDLVLALFGFIAPGLILLVVVFVLAIVLLIRSITKESIA